MGNVYSCGIAEADFEYQDDSRIVDTSLIKSDLMDKVEINTDDKIEASEENAKLIGIDLLEMKKHDSWYKIDDKFFYFKNRKNNLAILNELICVELSKYLNIPTIEYKIATEQGEIVGLASVNFLNKDYEYTKCIHAPKSLIQDVRKMLTDRTFECDENLRKQITALVIRNMYSSLIDRRENAYYATSGEKLIIPPSHDYESAFRRIDIDSSTDPLFSYSFNPDSVAVLKENNPYFSEYMEAIKEYNMLKAMASIEEKIGVFFPNQYVEYYVNYDTNKKEFMKTLGL